MVIEIRLGYREKAAVSLQNMNFLRHYKIRGQELLLFCPQHHKNNGFFLICKYGSKFFFGL